MFRYKLREQLEKSLTPHSLLITDNNNEVKFLPIGGEDYILMAKPDGLEYHPLPNNVVDVNITYSQNDNDLYLDVNNSNSPNSRESIKNEVFHNVSGDGNVIKVRACDTLHLIGKGLEINTLQNNPFTFEFNPVPTRNEFINLTGGNTVTIPKSLNPFDVKRNGVSLLSNKYTIAVSGNDKIITFAGITFQNDDVIILSF